MGAGGRYRMTTMVREEEEACRFRLERPRGKGGGGRGRGEEWRLQLFHVYGPSPLQPSSPCCVCSLARLQLWTAETFLFSSERRNRIISILPSDLSSSPPSIIHPSIFSFIHLIHRQAGHASQDLPEAGGRRETCDLRTSYFR